MFGRASLSPNVDHRTRLVLRYCGLELVVFLDAQSQSHNGQCEVKLRFCGVHLFNAQIGGIEQIGDAAILYGVSPKSKRRHCRNTDQGKSELPSSRIRPSADPAHKI